MIYVDIEKKFGKFTLKTKFQFDNEIMGLLGASGSGKSLTLKCIAGIEKPDKGRIVLNDRVLFDSEKKINISPKDRKIGYLFQDYALFPNMNVYENIKVGIREGENFDKLIMEKLEEMRISHLKDKKINEISGGEKQRVALARLLINKPEIILLDEPFSALDDYLKSKIELEVSEVLRNYKIPTILVSHSRAEVYRLCNEICVMSNGKSEDLMNKKELFKNPKTFSSCLISGCKNFSKIEKISENRLRALDWNIELETSDTILEEHKILGIRAHLIELEKSDENSFAVEVERVVEDVFTYIILVRKKDAKNSIRIEVDKHILKKVENRENLFITMRKEDLILMVENN
ncbi:ATP-binding cassette domain-containing protein [Parvimonas micra]|uniref:sulfate/molybdate ABC transporter ATP-binding protein n=1 Tax=Parvimonas micra TaxID=33033 RepID=UPI001E4C0077|nr:ATP-binding cassette domain-containing protein [Parvimonas micra]MCE3020082.1 ATP-binding cassette domain-containing protein [Parvimonas micra]